MKEKDNTPDNVAETVIAFKTQLVATANDPVNGSLGLWRSPTKMSRIGTSSANPYDASREGAQPISQLSTAHLYLETK